MGPMRGGGRGTYVKATGVLSLLGFALSAYALYVEIAAASDPLYTAMCDISARISCSLVFTSKYGTGFGLVEKLLGPDSMFNQPNGVFGLILYPVFFLTSIIPNPLSAMCGVLLGIAGIIMSIYLGYVLFIILEDACVVCISTYLVNIGLFVVTWLNYKYIVKSTSKSKIKTSPSKKSK